MPLVSKGVGDVASACGIAVNSQGRLPFVARRSRKAWFITRRRLRPSASKLDVASADVEALVEEFLLTVWL